MDATAWSNNTVRVLAGNVSNITVGRRHGEGRAHRRGEHRSQAERQISKLKLLNGQTFGRAGFDLLQRPVLLAA